MTSLTMMVGRHGMTTGMVTRLRALFYSKHYSTASMTSLTMMVGRHGMTTGMVTRMMTMTSSRNMIRPLSLSTTTQTKSIGGICPSHVREAFEMPTTHPPSSETEAMSMADEVSQTLEKVKQKQFQKITDPEKLGHFKASSKKTDENWILPHPIWSESELNNVKVTHLPPEGTVDALALATVRGLRMMFDKLSGFNANVRSERIWINRITFLETLAGVPGMVAAMTRHLHSLRRMRRDHGWIHTLIEEAENERIHLLTALQVRKPSIFFRMCVAAAQGTFLPFFGIAYLVSPHYCHRFVGYLEEEAVITYTKCIQDIDNGPLSHWKEKPAPEVAIEYWNLPANATMEDVIYNIRADEAHHRIVNHTLGSMRPDDYNPYKPGE